LWTNAEISDTFPWKRTFSWISTTNIMVCPPEIGLSWTNNTKNDGLSTRTQVFVDRNKYRRVFKEI